MTDRTEAHAAGASRWIDFAAKRIATLGTAGLLLVVATHALPPSLRWPVTLAGELECWWLGALAALLPIALLARRGKRGVLAVAATVANAALFIGLYATHRLDLSPPNAEVSAGCIRVATWNLKEDYVSPSALAANIAAFNADIVALEEVSAAAQQEFDRAFADRYPIRIYQGAGLEGTGLLARGELVNRGLLSPAGFKPMIRAKINIRGTEAEYFVVHLSPWTGLLGSHTERGTGVRVIAGATRGAARSVLLGDFNSTILNGSIGVLRDAGWNDAFTLRHGDSPFTFPVAGRFDSIPFGPFVGIDHVLVTGDVSVAQAWRGPDGGSDHLPVVADLKLR